MSPAFRNQQNNWAYILLLVIITAVAAFGILSYSRDTIKEINALSARSNIIEKQQP